MVLGFFSYSTSRYSSIAHLRTHILCCIDKIFTFLIIAVVFIKITDVVEHPGDTKGILPANRDEVVLALVRHLAEIDNLFPIYS